MWKSGSFEIRVKSGAEPDSHKSLPNLHRGFGVGCGNFGNLWTLSASFHPVFQLS